MEETWEYVVGYEEHYQVSNSGKVYSLKSNKELSPNIVRSGYKIVRLYKNGWSRDYLIHRLVAEAYCNKNNDNLIVNHMDGNKLNNYFLNLEWITQSENQLHAIRTGLKGILNGEKHPMAKITKDDVINIRKIRKEQNLTINELAIKFNLHFSTIHRIIERQTWKNI